MQIKRVIMNIIIVVFLTAITNIVLALFNIELVGWVSAIFIGVWALLADFITAFLFKNNKK